MTLVSSRAGRIFWGALVAVVLTSAPERVAAQGTGAITGVVFDSLRGVGLAGATVQVLGTQHRARTDERGMYTIEGLPAGEMALDVQHPLLDTLGITLASHPFQLVIGQHAVMSVRTMSLDEFRLQQCPRGGASRGPGVLFGILRDADADSALAGGTASLVYKDPDAVENIERVRTSRVGADGRFVICGLPLAYKGTVQVGRSGFTTAEVRVDSKSFAFTTVGVTIGTVAAHTAVLVGRVMQRSGAGVPGVQVVVAGTPVMALTDSAGRYRLESLPSGTLEVVARRIGYAATTETAMLTVREPRRLDIVVSEAQTLLAVKVTGKLDDGLGRVGFTNRQKNSAGRFVTPEEIDRRKPQLFTDLLRQMPGIHVSNQGPGRTIESTRAGGCVNFIVDNARFDAYQPGDIDAAFSSATVGAVESYGSAAETPGEFLIPGKNCATIVMWTRQRLSRP